MRRMGGEVASHSGSACLEWLAGWLKWGGSDAETPERDGSSALCQRSADTGYPRSGEGVGGGQRLGTVIWNLPLNGKPGSLLLMCVRLLTLVTPGGKWHPQQQTLPMPVDLVALPQPCPVCRGL